MSSRMISLAEYQLPATKLRLLSRQAAEIAEATEEIANALRRFDASLERCRMAAVQRKERRDRARRALDSGNVAEMEVAVDELRMHLRIGIRSSGG